MAIGIRITTLVYRTGQIASKFSRVTKALTGGHLVIQWWGYAAHPEDVMLAFQTGGLSNELAALKQLAESTKNAFRIFKGINRIRQAQGIAAILTKDILREGSDAADYIHPPGWNLLPEDNRARGHLLANVLGGPGDMPDNLVSMYQSANLRMKTYEMKVRDAVEAGEKVHYIVTPKYGQNLFPDEIHLFAEGDKGFSLNVVISNVK